MPRVDQCQKTRRIGEFGYQPVVGLCEPYPEQAVRNEQTVMGLPLVGSYLYGAFVTADGYRAAPQRPIHDELGKGMTVDGKGRRADPSAHPGDCKPLRG